MTDVRESAAPYFARLDLWEPDDIYSNHRIPGMLVTRKGTLLVYCEARREASDWALMDVLLQRSEDHGKTFSPKTVLAQGTEAHKTVNNPVMVQDQNGRIHFLYCEDYTVNGGRILRRWSDDDGLSWSDPVDLTAFAMPEFHNAFALGPGHGIVMRDGTLVIPVWMVPKYYEAPLSSHKPSVVTTFYSCDDGETWALGELLGTNQRVISPNETTAALTSDGSVHLNIRHNCFCRGVAYSKNGFSDWQDYGPDHNLPDPHCFGSVAAYDDGVHPYTLVFANCASKTERKNVVVRASTDDAKTYPIVKTIDADRGGYVEVAVDSTADLIYVLYENNKGETDHLVTFNYAWLTNDDE